MIPPFDSLRALPQGVFRTDAQSDSALFRLWAPKAQTVALVTYDADGQATDELPMQGDDVGYFTLTRSGVSSGFRYAYKLDGGMAFPDPASRWQPDGVHKPSAVYFPEDFAWTDSDWSGVPMDQLVVYELHVGTFSPEGTFEAIIPRLESLKQLGITAIELLPIAQFPGTRNWGYDGVHWYAAQNSYGGPRGLQKLIDAAHGIGMAVILDVVYNHFGPEGNYAGAFGHYFTDHYHTPWGSAVNYDAANSDPVRHFAIDNAVMWVRDFHFDGLRLDAIHAIYDLEAFHVLEELQSQVQDVAKRTGRHIPVIAESNLNNPRLTDSRAHGGYALDGVWIDDFHHAVHTLLTGDREGYYRDFGGAQDLIDCYTKGVIYDGKYSIHRGRRHGKSMGATPREKFVVAIQNHDQVGNRAQGERFGQLLPFSAQRLAAGLMLVSPFTPMLFMGEEYGEDRPFLFFCDFLDEGLQEAVRKGRRAEFEKHAFEWAEEPPDPTLPETYDRCQLSWDWENNPERSGLRQLYRELLIARRAWPELRQYELNVQGHTHGDGDRPIVHLHYGPAEAGLDVLVNLSSEQRPMPDDLNFQVQHLRISTADKRFGGPIDRTAAVPVTSLEPHELLVFGGTVE
jgi:maltooligosyltrehalose trehalohydrolase